MKVFITGTGIISSMGNSVDDAMQSLIEGRSSVRFMPEWKQYSGLFSHLAAPVVPFDSKGIPRQVRRSMSAMSEMALLASHQALKQAGIERLDQNLSEPGRSALMFGSSSGSPGTFETYFTKLHQTGGFEGQLSTTFFKTMNHSVTANVALGLGYDGAAIAPSSACSSSSQAMILAWELLQTGLYDIAIAGGADELHHTTAGVFDVVLAASRGHEDHPTEASRPFDKKRDGLVVSEGASAVILETEAHMKKRGGVPLAEFCAGAYFCDGSHMSQPRTVAMKQAMNLALGRAKKTVSEIDYVNAHATGTVLGDAEEGRAIGELLGHSVPVSSLKGHMGHSLAACGSFEAIASMEMMRRSKLIPTLNLTEIDPECGGICLPKNVEERKLQTVMSNNFAFGGMNTSLILSLP